MAGSISVKFNLNLLSFVMDPVFSEKFAQRIVPKGGVKVNYLYWDKVELKQNKLVQQSK